MTPLVYVCEGVVCVASLHPASGSTGVLLVSGGQDARAGAHGWQRDLATGLARNGYPILRFDRRGVGDSAGPRTSYRESRPDLLAALEAFRTHAPHVSRVIGLGNCDAATALILFGREIGIDGLVLLNPWLVPSEENLPPPAAIRARYRSRLTDPAAWRRLVRGEIDLRKAVHGLGRAARSASNTLAGEVATALTSPNAPPAELVLAQRDATALACASLWRTSSFRQARDRVRVTTIDTGSHSFGGEADAEQLLTVVTTVLSRLR